MTYYSLSGPDRLKVAREILMQILLFEGVKIAETDVGLALLYVDDCMKARDRVAPTATIPTSARLCLRDKTYRAAVSALSVP